MTVFVDEGVDKNNDGVDDAYVIYSSEMNAKLYVSLLNKDYTGPAAAGDTADDTQMAARIVSDNSREAPAVFKFDGWYYLITSGTDGWNSTAHVYYRSQNLLSGWEKMGNPAKDDTGKCFDTQVTWVLPVDAETGKFIYMGDRWNGSNLTDSRTIWLPLQVTGDHTLSILNRSHWTCLLYTSHARDKSIFMDGGKAYLIAAGNEEGESANRTIYIHQLTSDWEAVDTEAGVIAKVFEGGFREAPVVIKDQGIYYMFASQAAGWLPSKTAYIRCPDP